MKEAEAIKATTRAYDRDLPLSLYPTAAQSRCTEGQVADFFMIDIRHVRAMNSFTKDLLIARAIEGGYIPREWAPRSREFHRLLDELSRALMAHWSILLTQTEREERRHVLVVVRILRSQFNFDLTN